MLNHKTVTAVITLMECESFQEAANILNMSPAAFSRHIKAAEDYAGFQLFTRGRTAVRPTGPGEVFIRHAQDLHRAIARFDQATHQIQQGAQGELLRITCGPLATRTLVAPALREAVRRFPSLRFKVLVRATSEPVLALKRGEIDLFVGDLTHTPLIDGIQVRVVDRRPVIFVAASGHPLLQGGPYGLPDILRFPLLSPFLHRHWRNTVTKALGDDETAKGLVDCIPAVECDDYALLLDLIDDSTYVCGGVRENFAEGLASGRLQEISVAGQTPWNISVVRRNQDTSDALDTVWSSLVSNCISQGV
ncbi:LysR family transcriptional regulator [Ruegeria pomeroyi]|uniref:LysR substrate-binding domain-containing protein n=1 Tax=Ruegeria pomeroyi TaxID=89184 RepID=UPI001F256EC1|nr:LysR family transcriptional regulator [Ruegeria pomeroyi]MCE8509341.1 LysR family transcriptional regulator [Ruegeria pomeroyi]